MTATELLVWGVVVHLVIDWLAQNEWMAANKAKRRFLGCNWWDRHPAAYVHAGLHGVTQLIVFPWPAALAVGITHLLIDTRKPVEWWSKLIRQTQPSGEQGVSWKDPHPIRFMDIGAEVRIWSDQVWHIAVVASAALVVSA